MQRIEVQHHTDEQVRKYVDDALEIALGADVPGELVEVVFTEAVRLLSSKTVQVVAQPTGVAPVMLGLERGH